MIYTAFVKMPKYRHTVHRNPFGGMAPPGKHWRCHRCPFKSSIRQSCYLSYHFRAQSVRVVSDFFLLLQTIVKESGNSPFWRLPRDAYAMHMHSALSLRIFFFTGRGTPTVPTPCPTTPRRLQHLPYHLYLHGAACGLQRFSRPPSWI